jgi:hypothetical protein
MRRSLVRSAALVVCLSSAALRAEENDACKVVTRDLRGQIEAMKLLKAKEQPLRFDDPSKKSRGPESPQTILARDREQANALNAMLPGMGCPSLDIDHELAQPLNAALLPPARAAAHKHRKP